MGTIDQVLLSALKVKHAHLRASSLLRHLLVVDEVHASDTYMTTVLREVLSRHRASGGHALLMSATLGGSTRAALLGKSKAPSLEEALATPYPLLTHQVESSEAASERAIRHEGRERSVRVELCSEMQDHSVTARRALVAARAGARVLVLRNTVRACHATQLELEALAGSQEAELLFGVGSVVAPHHSRFAKNDRTALDEAIEKRFGKVRANSSGAVAVATQTVQQSLDLDADLLITDLCPMDVLLQRIGRLHRHERASRPPGFEAPKVIVLVPAERDLAAYLRPKREVRGPRGSGFGLVYEDLRVLQATWEQLIVRGTLEIPKDARALVERSVHPEVLRNLVAERGGLWPEHQQHVLGEEGADRSVAKQNLFRFTDSYDDLSFMRSEDGHIKTRLGEGDRPSPPRTEKHTSE
ncbi:MAG: CRISPR-associated helicase Cas3', partial [Myxococcota bacterium]